MTAKTPDDLEVVIGSSMDDSRQKALFWRPERAAPSDGAAPVPLVVALHTWSADYRQASVYQASAAAWGWVFVAPDFRGPNVRPEACASEVAVQDVLDAVDYAKGNARVDARRIYLVGASGGGHMALMMAAMAPQLWAGVSAWVPVSDLAAWHRFGHGRYPAMVEACCGGPPGAPASDAQYAARSPVHVLARAKGLPLDINAGIHDGHAGSVPISHSLNAFNVLAAAGGMPGRALTPVQVDEMTETERIPAALSGEAETDPAYGAQRVLFRRVAGAARITIFEGGHTQHIPAAFSWLSAQARGRPADFRVAREPRSPGGAGGEAVAVSK